MENLEYWKQRALLAEDYIDKIPCDPDITAEQYGAYNRWKNFKSSNFKTLTMLYKILSVSMKERKFFNEGICNNINRLLNESVITADEHGRLLEHFMSQKPTETLHREYYEPGELGSYWWPRTPIGLANRKIFITKLIYITSI